MEEDLDDDDESEEDDEYYSDDEEVDGRGKVGRGAARDSDDAESPESIEENRVWIESDCACFVLKSRLLSYESNLLI